MATHLTQKPGESTWYVRMQVPEDVRSAFGGRAKLIKTTGTSNKAEAMVKRLPILAAWTEQIARARAEKAAARELWREEVAAIGQEIRSHRDTAILKAINEPPERVTVGSKDEAAALIEQHTQTIHQLLEGLREYEQQGADGLRESVATQLTSRPDATPVEHAQFTAAATQKALVQMTHKRMGLTPAELAEAGAIAAKPEIYKPRSPITPSRLAAFRAYREKAEIAPKTVDQQESKLSKLSSYLNNQGKPLEHEVVTAWLDSLPLTPKTKIQYLLAGSTFWKWAIKHDARWRDDFSGKANPFEKQELPKLRVKDKAKTARKAFTMDELQRIYTVAQEKGQGRLCDLMALGLLTGARIEELAQLRKDSIVTVEGIHSFRIDDSKTLAGIREIPVHPALEPLIKRLIADSPDGYLLPSSAGNKYDNRSDPLSKAFGRLKTSLGFGKQHVFHSVRATTITLLLRAGVPGTTVANIVGHETGLVTFDVYDEGASPQQKLEAISKLPTLDLG